MVVASGSGAQWTLFVHSGVTLHRARRSFSHLLLPIPLVHSSSFIPRGRLTLPQPLSGNGGGDAVRGAGHPAGTNKHLHSFPLITLARPSTLLSPPRPL
ncbi:hypothetical protein E2C01_061996 [Portunus trituberculatus]|uniref:Uncharacterized protein n=1 Tax=Portunus trituberculatus TaxID=210409 RepID=A0A5B7H6R7_PORTR|nr:hypothetical protein [Portunus trituberculatus]